MPDMDEQIFAKLAADSQNQIESARQIKTHRDLFSQIQGKAGSLFTFEHIIFLSLFNFFIQ